MKLEIKNQSVVFHGDTSSIEVVESSNNTYHVMVWKVQKGKEYIDSKRDIFGFNEAMAYVAVQLGGDK